MYKIGAQAALNQFGIKTAAAGDILRGALHAGKWAVVPSALGAGYGYMTGDEYDRVQRAIMYGGAGALAGAGIGMGKKYWDRTRGARDAVMGHWGILPEEYKLLSPEHKARMDFAQENLLRRRPWFPEAAAESAFNADWANMRNAQAPLHGQEQVHANAARDFLDDLYKKKKAP